MLERLLGILSNGVVAEPLAMKKSAEDIWKAASQMAEITQVYALLD